jgi:hypothetical protein
MPDMMTPLKCRPLAVVVCVYISLTTQSNTASAAELFVADRATNRVLSFDEATGDFVRVVTATGLDGPLV